MYTAITAVCVPICYFCPAEVCSSSGGWFSRWSPKTSAQCAVRTQCRNVSVVTPVLLVNVCEMCSKIEAHPNARAISAGLIWDKEYTATFIFTVLWVSFCVKQP